MYVVTRYLFLWALLASAGVASKAAALTTAESSFILPEIMWHPSHEYVVLVSKLARVALLDRGPTGYFQIQN
jgi:hypothetical protein